MRFFTVNKMLGARDESLGNGAPFTEFPLNSDCTCLVLSMRHLGDAVIGSGLINALHRRYPKMAIDVLGRPELEDVIRVFSTIRDHIGINIPLFGHHQRTPSSSLAALRAMRLIRSRKYDVCINLIGDVRENALGALSGAKWTIGPIWERDHLFRRKMTATGADWFINRNIVIPSIYPSFYASMDFFATQLGLQGLEWRGRSSRHNETGDRITVVVHPGASHASRLWPHENWRALMRLLRLRGYKIKIMGARFERTSLLAAFDRELAEGGVELITEDIAGFASHLAGSDVLIGMDSFSAHAAYALGVPMVVLNGSADPSIFTPPGALSVSAGDLCKAYPCYYRYPCERTESEYICVRGITPSVIMDALDLTLEHNRGVQLMQKGRVSNEDC